MRFLSISARSFWAVVALVGLGSVVLVAGLWTVLGRLHSPGRGNEFAALQQRVNPQEIQAWAKALLREHTNAAELFPYFDGTTADPTNVIQPPAFLKRLAMFGRTGPLGISVSGAGPASNRCVGLLYVQSPGFGGDGHIIEAGDESFRIVTNAQCVEWIPGVYYLYTHSR